jgi:hypothetical protein
LHHADEHPSAVCRPSNRSVECVNQPSVGGKSSHSRGERARGIG